jgi:hypothetical protein
MAEVDSAGARVSSLSALGTKDLGVAVMRTSATSSGGGQPP